MHDRMYAFDLISVSVYYMHIVYTSVLFGMV